MLAPYANYNAVNEAPSAPEPEGESNEESRKETQLVTSQA